MHTLIFKKNKKGNAVIEVLFILIVVFAFALISMFVYNSFSDIVDDSDELFTLNESKEVLQDSKESFPSVFDGAVVFLLVGLWIASLVFAFMVDSHPIFFIISILLLIFCIIGIVFLQNFYEEFFLTDSENSEIVEDFPMTNWIFQHLVIIGVVIGFTIMLVLYGKVRS